MQIPITIIIISLSFVLLAIYLILYWISYVPIKTQNESTHTKNEGKKMPSFSVVIITHDCDSMLERLINTLVTQEYNNFEIVVVNNASTDNTSDVIKRASIEHPSLVRHTYMPQNKNGILHMSIATTLGVRAARNEWIVLLKPTSYPKSRYWLSSIAEKIMEGANICIGYNDYYGYDNSTWVLKAIRWRKKAQILNYRAIMRGKCKPIECESSNLVFSKKEFMENGGYGRWLSLKNYHENPYITTYSIPHKTAFLTSPESQVETILPPIKELWDTEYKLIKKSHHKFSKTTKLRRSHYTILRTLYAISFCCMLVAIYFCISPLTTDSFPLKDMYTYFIYPYNIPAIPLLLATTFVIITIIHCICKYRTQRRDNKNLYAPLITDPSDIISK